MLDLIPSLSSWPPAVAGERYAVATVVAATGSVPRPVGTSMLVAESGAVLGSLSGGCVEGAVVALALEAMHDGGTRHGTFGYSAADAFAVGLTCGGELGIHIEPAGRIPINPSGGLIGTGHPVGATGARMLLDAARQVTGTAGDYQVEGAKTFATLNIGGSCATVVSFVVGTRAGLNELADVLLYAGAIAGEQFPEGSGGVRHRSGKLGRAAG